MTNYTPAQARELATRLQDPQDHYEADSPAALNAILLSLCQDAANDLRLLADQVERLTAERDALKAQAIKFNWVLEALTEPSDCKKELLLFAAIDRLDLPGLTSVELVAYLDTAIADAMKEPK